MVCDPFCVLRESFFINSVFSFDSSSSVADSIQSINMYTASLLGQEGVEVNVPFKPFL